jgi:glycerol-3-phosphate acyltransferase PlsX
MRIVLDAMGSDRHPQPDVDGAVQAAREFGVDIVLVGQRGLIEAELAKYDVSGLPLSVIHASQVLEMTDEPSRAAKRKKDSSMVVGMGLLKQKEADAFVSAGNSGGVLAVALLYLGRIRGVKRPALSAVLPTRTGSCLMLDVGANADCKPLYLQQFAIMGNIYAEHVMGIAHPRVAIVSNGEEEGKGSTLVKETYPLLKDSNLNFVGNAEGKDILSGFADVIVTDGFTGNVAVKLAEGVAGFMLQILEEEIRSRPLASVGALLAKPAFRQVKKRLDYREYGGAPLLGVDGTVIVGHGRSDALAIKNAIRMAKQAVEQNTLDAIRDAISQSLTSS